MLMESRKELNGGKLVTKWFEIVLSVSIMVVVMPSTLAAEEMPDCGTIICADELCPDPKQGCECVPCRDLAQTFQVKVYMPVYMVEDFETAGCEYYVDPNTGEPLEGKIKAADYGLPYGWITCRPCCFRTVMEGFTIGPCGICCEF